MTQKAEIIKLLEDNFIFPTIVANKVGCTDTYVRQLKKQLGIGNMTKREVIQLWTKQGKTLNYIMVRTGLSRSFVKRIRENLPDPRIPKYHAISIDMSKGLTKHQVMIKYNICEIPKKRESRPKWQKILQYPNLSVKKVASIVKCSVDYVNRIRKRYLKGAQ